MVNRIFFPYTFLPIFFIITLLLSSVLSAQEMPHLTKNQIAQTDYIVEELYPRHNDIKANRLNLIVVGAEYPNFRELKKIAKDMIAFHNENRRGLMQIKPFSDPGFGKYFNFWICRKIAKSGLTYNKLTNNKMWQISSLLYNDAIEDLNRRYGVNLVRGNRKVVGILLVNADPREIPGYGYGGGSFGRDCIFTVWHISHPWFSYDDMIVTHVHELIHSIPELHDETTGAGTAYDIPDWKTRDYKGQFFVPGSHQDPGKITKEKFLKLSDEQKIEYVKKYVPWRTYIGQGQGDLQVGVFEGGLGKSKYIYRSVKNSIMNYPYGLIPGKTLGLGTYLEDVVRKRIKEEFGR